MANSTAMPTKAEQIGMQEFNEGLIIHAKATGILGHPTNPHLVAAGVFLTIFLCAAAIGILQTVSIGTILYFWGG